MTRHAAQKELAPRDIMLAIIERNIKIYPNHFFAHKNKVLDQLEAERKVKAQEQMTKKQ
jgi:hypothetical protein